MTLWLEDEETTMNREPISEAKGCGYALLITIVAAIALTVALATA